MEKIDKDYKNNEIDKFRLNFSNCLTVTVGAPLNFTIKPGHKNVHTGVVYMMLYNKP